MGLSNMPPELLLIITTHITDPCDLLALRLTSTLFNNLLSERFSVTFPRHLYMRNDQYVHLDTMLFWAAEHNHMRFLQKLYQHGTWPRSSRPVLGALRQAAMNAVRHGNGPMMSVIIDFALDEYDFGFGLHKEILGECFEVALGEDQVEIGKRLIDGGVKPSWSYLGADLVLVNLAVEAHHIDLVEYMVCGNDETGWDSWDREDFAVVQDALRIYIDRLVCFDTSWCQRTLHMFLARENMFTQPRDWGAFLIRMEPLKRRKCGPECDVWFGENRRLDEKEMLLELIKVGRRDYAQFLIDY